MRWTRVVGAALLLGWGSACDNPCDLVVGCTDSRRVAVEGRVLETINGHGVAGATVRMLAQHSSSVDSTEASSDSRGLFSLSLAAPGPDTPRVALRVIPPNRPGYLVQLTDCKPVMKWGDACVITPVVNEPPFPLLLLVDGNGNPVTGVHVIYKRTGGANLMVRTGEGAIVVDSVTSITGPDGFANPFPIEIPAGNLVFAGSNDAVLGDLILDFPAPVGRVIRKNYPVTPTVFYGLRTVTTERVATP
jgi:hypothetical protein